LEGWDSTIELHPHSCATLIIIHNYSAVVKAFFKKYAIYFLENQGLQNTDPEPNQI